MDAFEQIIGQLLDEDKYWVRHSVKIDLTKEEKIAIGSQYTPRPEIDIVAYDVANDTIYLLEVKSFLDSPGVALGHVNISQEQQSGRYKLLTAENYRNVISERLRKDFQRSGHIKLSTNICYGLIAGKIYQNKEDEFTAYFRMKNWLFWGPTAIKEKIKQLASKGYENNAVTIAAKLLIRN